MEEAPKMAVSDPSLGLLTFLAHFDSLEFNSLLCDSLCLLRACHS